MSGVLFWNHARCHVMIKPLLLLTETEETLNELMLYDRHFLTLPCSNKYVSDVTTFKYLNKSSEKLTQVFKDKWDCHNFE
ncbi:CLUMA_CG006213, isoform A [Clunio marinus]|uniref:CLUMA_CG006213, isoform A n=1 Tax=Clunio marinus TaxID=568069 RepID=A0A1J1HYM3_9DIPT|nr:CLUMA_CG006213, isoform A [Clunio marinus]